MLLTTLFAVFASVRAQETALMTGGFNGYEGARSSAELLDDSCVLPTLPWYEGTNRTGRSDHVVLETGDGLVLTCGGEAADGTDDFSCVSLDLTLGVASEQAWELHSVLDVERIMATGLTIPGFGSFILGGFKQLTSSFLPLGATEWQAGPTLLGTEETSYYGVCSVLLETEQQFLLIGGNADGLLGGTRVAQYDAARGDFEKWDSLYTDRWGHACARIGSTVVIAGGVSPFFTIYDSTTLLDLTTREQRDGGTMSSPRTWFGMALVDGRVLAFGGTGGLDPLDSVEEWEPKSDEWIVEEKQRMPTAMHGFDTIPVKIKDFCRSSIFSSFLLSLP